MEITKTMYAIRHKESGLYYFSGLVQEFTDFDTHIDFYGDKSMLEDKKTPLVASEVKEEYEDLFSKYLNKYGMYAVPIEDLELVEFEYSLKQK